MNTFKNSLMTKFLVLLLLAGIATLAAPMVTVQAAIPRLHNVEIVSEGPQEGKSLYAYARQRLLGDWEFISGDKTTLIADQTGSLLVPPGYTLKDSLGTGEAVKFFKVGDPIYFKMTFRAGWGATAALSDLEVTGMPKFRLGFDGRESPTPAVYDETHADNDPDNGVLVFKYIVAEGDECFGDGISFVRGATNPYISDNDNNIKEDGSNDEFKLNASGSDGWEHGIPHNKIFIFYFDGGTPPWPRPRETAYLHKGLNYLIDGVKANVRITGIIKPATHTGDLRKEAVNFRTGGFTATDPNVGVSEVDNLSGPFDVEFLFFNYGTGYSDEGVLADTTQGFTKEDIKITGPGVAADQAGWTVSAPVLIGLDHRDPAFPDEGGDPQGRVKHSASFKVYKATITPPSGYDGGDVMITVPAGATMDIAGNPNKASNTLTVVSTATFLGVPTKGSLDLPSVTLAKGEFAVLAHSGASVSNTGLANRFYPLASLPNLDTLFTGNGGTLELIAKGDASVGPIITEIMWGTDLSQPDSKLSQWLEIYNAGAATNLSNYQLKVTPFSATTFSADAKAVDTVSNLGDGKWAVPGQSGRSLEVAATPTTAGIVAVPLISMRRDLGLDANGKFKAAVNSDGALTDVNDGTLEGSWKVSTAPALNMGANRIGSPWSAHVMQITRADQTPIPYSPIIINEIGNNTGDVNDWIELRNVSDAEVNLKKWELSVITAKGTDTSLIKFEDKDYKLGAGKILLIVNKDPLETPLARGKKFGDADGMTAVADQENRGIESDAMFYDAKGGLNALPESGKFLLVLRSESKLGSHEKIIDITGTLFEADTKLYTDIWPLQATPAGHSNVIDGTGDEDFRAGKVYKRNDAAGGTGEKDWGVVGYTGIGYDRTADSTLDAHGGTPGFPNDSLKEKPGDLSDGAVTISEIMVVSNNGRYPQWIELRNSSATQGINLDAWRLRIENVGEVDSRRSVTIDLTDGFRLPPNQTMLIATRRGASSAALTPQRVMILWADSDARQALEVDISRFRMLSTEGFTLKLFGKEQQTSDTPVDTVTIGKELLTAAKIGDATERISLIRYYNDGIAAGWGSAKDSLQLTRNPSDTYYGASDDIGTPGFYPGSALPVSLSSFLPKRTDAGVVIKWTTQSELNNAGFNILRSATKTGAFVVINPTMIQGAGTTGEKHTYSYTDKTAKPNIVYYYQIEDVSFDGNRQRLTGATRLRGHIGAAGKLTTTWGDLKVRD